MAAVFTGVTGMSFLIFNLLCAPCFAAMGAIKREMNTTKWFWFAIGYECGFAYVISFIVNQIGSLCTGAVAGIGGIIEVILGLVVLADLVYMVFRKDMRKRQENIMGTVIVNVVLFVVVTLIVKLLCKKHLKAKKSGTCCCGCSGCCGGACKK